ncbi:esterase [Litchfieldella qijiaojingensis]|uniref:Esterase n=1 Tax=Litchfieldella qijiaojingensis TaxID=980347 RepID=A0ABQ2Z848_9GAMM|nr:PHB depolymerase family esterase [Halomonas qijiaojingensis]GGY06423.1 esterase [Halomonas qijiaojingensis]
MMNTTMMAGLQEATRLTRAGQLHEATALIQRTLRGVPSQDVAAQPTSDASAPGETLEGSYCVIDDEPASAAKSAAGESPWRASPAPEAKREDTQTRPEGPQPNPARTPAAPRPFAAGLHDVWRETLHRFREPEEAGSQPLSDRVPDSVPDAGKFTTGTFTNHAGTRDYKLYIPSGYHGQSLPLIVMLHGCTQDPDDFAAGTGMNKLAEEQLCFVLYPAQSTAANHAKCWNWFMEADQQRERGEPAIIAGLTRQVLDEHRLDERRVYVAGLSAGGAMAMTLAMTYPDLYAAVGIHSGLPHAATHDLPSALAAMQGGTGPLASHKKTGAVGRPASTAGVPAVIFHGDRDATVHPCNGDQVVAQCVSSPAIGEASNEGRGARVERGRVPNGHAYTRTTHHDASGQPTVEQWLIHGAGHAWSGGDPRGSYTDPKGPDAAKEMLRFFFAHPKIAESAD